MSNIPNNPGRSEGKLPRSPRGALLLRCAMFAGHAGGRLACLPRDERGTISIISIVALLLFLTLLGMVINVGRHVDDKIKQQNAADAATYSGGVVLARGMNTLAFSNHLLCDVFALTAFMREARDRNAESLVPDVLAAWSKTAPIFEKATFSKFAALGAAIPPKVAAEQEMVRTFSEFAAAISEQVLPTLEAILAQELIPNFERAIVQTLPTVAQETATEVARQHGPGVNGQGRAYGVLWRLNGQAVAFSNETDPQSRTLPAVDPAPGGTDVASLPFAAMYFQTAVADRERLAKMYLNQWNNHILGLFPKYAKMSQFFGLWQTFTCGQLDKLLNQDYPQSNLLFQIRRLENGLTPEEMRQALQQHRPTDWSPLANYLELNYRFGGVAYRKPLVEMGRLFHNRLAADSQAYAEVALFLPEPRSWFSPGSPGSSGGSGASAGDNFFGQPLPPDPAETNPGTGGGGSGPHWYRDSWPTEWSLLTQHWTVQLVPATSETFVSILQAPPQQGAPGITPANLGSVSGEQLRQVNTH